PSVIARRWSSFVPFSIEIGQDWGQLQAELTGAMADSKAVLDATKFLTGVGSTAEPGGILNIGGTGGLTTTQRVQTAVAATFAVGDPWSLKAAIPPRFTSNASVLASPTILD